MCERGDEPVIDQLVESEENQVNILHQTLLINPIPTGKVGETRAGGRKVLRRRTS